MDPALPPPPGGNDTVGKGFGIGCLTMVIAFVACVAVGSVIGYGASQALAHSQEAMLPVQLLLSALALVPLAAPIVVAMRLRGQGRPQAAKGVFAALLTAFGLGLLLAGACFGLLMNADFR
jgi:hypothetical protein